jgi:hypothetical protein
MQGRRLKYGERVPFAFREGQLVKYSHFTHRQVNEFYLCLIQVFEF